MNNAASSSPGNMELTKVNDRLDSIWIEYLDLLDTYTKAQSAIQQNLSAGFFSLARANADAPAGRRYGQDWYDDRMKATRRVLVEDSSGKDDLEVMPKDQGPRATIVMAGHTDANTKEPTPATKDEQPTQQPSPPATPEPESHESTEDTADDPKSSDPPAAAVSTDPLRWFGILIPSEMRRVQKAFSTVFEDRLVASHQSSDQQNGVQDDEPDLEAGPVAKAISAAGQMRALEVEIRRLRKSAKKLERSAAGTASKA